MLTQKQALKVIQWCTNQLGLEAWKLKLWYQDDIPKNFGFMGADISGGCLPNRQSRYAQIWISPSRCGTKKNIIITICHEMVHVFEQDNGLAKIDNNDSEHIAFRLEGVLAKAYLAGVKYDKWNSKN